MNALLSLYVYVKSMFEVEEGQDLIEYALIIGLVVLLVIGALTLLGPTIAAQFNAIESCVVGAVQQ
jgi:Flp pilus assembly pilin Flp